MVRSRVLIAAIVVCLSGSACGGKDSPTAPSGSGGLNGQWSGTTLQGSPFAFTVSSNRVTSVSVSYTFGSCSGSRTFSDVNAEIVDLRSAPTPPPPGASYYFATLLGSYSETDNTQIQGFFTSDRAANGIVLLVRPGCGESLVLWNATKR
jgi:hypothetical protein